MDITCGFQLHSDCERYWPEHGYQEYGSLAVSLVEETCMTDWNIRTFLVWVSSGQERNTSITLLIDHIYEK